MINCFRRTHSEERRLCCSGWTQQADHSLRGGVVRGGEGQGVHGYWQVMSVQQIRGSSSRWLSCGPHLRAQSGKHQSLDNVVKYIKGIIQRVSNIKRKLSIYFLEFTVSKHQSIDIVVKYIWILLDLPPSDQHQIFVEKVWKRKEKSLLETQRTRDQING